MPWINDLMNLNLEEIFSREAYLQCELYRVIKNYILTTKQTILHRNVFDLLDFKWESAFDILPEVPVLGERIDLLITVDDRPFLVIETKKRFKVESSSMAKKVAKTKKYAENIGARYYSICNGWINMIFSLHNLPYLLGVFGVSLDSDYAKKLLLGMVKFNRSSNLDVLSQLPGVPDSFDVEKKILPSVFKEYMKNDNRIGEHSFNQWIERVKS